MSSKPVRCNNYFFTLACINLGRMVYSLVFSNLPACLGDGAGKDGTTIAVRKVDVLDNLCQGTSVLSPLAPLLLLLLPAATFPLYSPLLASDPLLYCLLLGLVGSKITNRLIVGSLSSSPPVLQVAHMCKSSLAWWDSSMLAVLALGVHHLLGGGGSNRLVLLLALVGK